MACAALRDEDRRVAQGAGGAPNGYSSRPVLGRVRGSDGKKSGQSSDAQCGVAGSSGRVHETVSSHKLGPVPHHASSSTSNLLEIFLLRSRRPRPASDVPLPRPTVPRGSDRDGRALFTLPASREGCRASG